MRSLICLVLAITATAVMAQGTFLYTWHGASSLFQASFQIDADEQQPGAYFESGTFRNSFTVASPDHAFGPSTFASGDDASGFGPPLQLSVTMTDPAFGMGVHATSTFSGFYFINEYRLSDSISVLHESGYWTFSQVPEPAMPSFALLALAALFFRRLGPRRL
jgi:hypothetical protein